MNTTVSGLFRMTELIDQLKENYLEGGGGVIIFWADGLGRVKIF